MNTPRETAYQKVEEFGDMLATQFIRSSDEFFEASYFHQKAFGVCCLFHHAGHNGLQAVLDYNHSDGPCILLAAVEALDEMGAMRFHEIGKEYWERITKKAKDSGLLIPSKTTEGKRSDFYAIYDFWMREDSGYFVTQRELSGLGDEFLSCWESELPELTIRWIESKTTEPNQRLQTMPFKLPMNSIAQDRHV